MQPLAFYLLKVIACSGILLLYYRLALRNKRFHYYNRFYLLMVVAVSLLLPLLNFSWFTVESSNKAITLLTIVNVPSSQVYAIKPHGFSFASINWQLMSAIIYIGTALLLIFVLLTRVAKIYRLKKKYAVVNMAEFDFINTNIPQAPFSFLHNLFWRDDIDMNEATGRQVLLHELTHIRQKHTWDKLWMQIITSVLWVNPFFWFIQKELYMLHEFIADEKAIENNDGAAFAAMLLTSQYGKNIFAPAQQFSYSPIKRRLFMLTNLTKPRYSYARRIMALPLLAIVIMLFAFKLKAHAAAITKHAHTTVVKAATDTSSYNEDVIKEQLPQNVEDTAKPQPLYVVNGTVVEKITVDALNPSAIASINVLKDKTATEKYGDKGANGVIEITTKTLTTQDVKIGDSIKVTSQDVRIVDSIVVNKSPTGNTEILINQGFAKDNISGLKAQPVIIIDGKKMGANGLKNVNPDAIDHINVLKGKTATDRYGDDGNNGVVEITLKPTIGANGQQPTNASRDFAWADSHRYVIHSKNDSLNQNTYQITPSDSIQPAAFPGGDEAWAKYLSRQLRADIPSRHGAPPSNYTIMVVFTVDVDGSLSQIKAENNPGYGMAEEAVRVFQRGPKWIPAKLNGQPIAFTQKQGISFVVTAK